MAVAYETGALWSTTLPEGQRDYYEQLLLETLRTKSILVPFCAVKEDFRARDTGVIIYTEVMDTEPNWNALSETGIWLTGAHLDSRSVQIGLEIHGDVIKISDYNELTNFWANGDLRGLVRGKLGQNMVDYLDILARNAFLSSPYKTYAGTANTKRTELAQTDLFDTDLVDLMRVHLEEREIPGVINVQDQAPAIVCVTTPRVCHDIRTAAGSKWIEAQEYAGSVRLFTGEVGSWGGVRFIKTNRLMLRNYGEVSLQTTLTAPTVVGQGAAATVDTVYSVGQTGSTRTIPVASSAGFVAGEYITIHDTRGADDEPLASDGTQETRRIVEVPGGAVTLVLDKPLMKPHDTGDYVTRGVTVHASIFMGGPAVVYGIGERPHPLVLPKIDDLAMVQRFSWRAFCKMQMFRPEYIEVVESGGTVN
ncbi:MAG TPA: N4-gp56 family major capsid protein [Anaerolineae bacterium]|nr:N4-gp56 family major capsid protein [Anaerolineae bacterium]